MDAGSSCYAVAAARFAVSVSFVIKLMRRWRRTGSIELDRYGGWKRSTVLIHVGRVRALLEAEAP